MRHRGSHRRSRRHDQQRTTPELGYVFIPVPAWPRQDESSEDEPLSHDELSSDDEQLSDDETSSQDVLPSEDEPSLEDEAPPEREQTLNDEPSPDEEPSPDAAEGDATTQSEADF